MQIEEIRCVISRRMFAKVKSTLNSSRISRSGRIAFGDTLYRQMYSRSYKGHLKYTILIPFPHVPRVFIYGRQITLLGNKVTGVETKVFEARPRQSSRCSAFSKWNPSVCVAPTSLSSSFLSPHSLAVDRFHWGKSWILAMPFCHWVTLSRILDRSNVLATFRIAMRHRRRGQNGAIGGEKKSRHRRCRPQRYLFSRSLKLHW